VVQELTRLYTEWEQRCGVQEWEEIRLAGK
jgi:hypothetical protein